MPGSFEQSVLPHLDAAYNVARWIVRDEAGAQDVVQESYMRALRFYDGLRGEEALPWLLRIVRNAAFDWLEKRQRDRRVERISAEEEVADDKAEDPAAMMSEKMDVAALLKAVEELPEEFREAIVLRELEGMSYKEIAAATEVSVGTVMSRLSRARRRLQAAMVGTEVDHGM